MHSEKWTPEEDGLALDLFERGTPLEEIQEELAALGHERSIRAIKAYCKKLQQRPRASSHELARAISWEFVFSREVLEDMLCKDNGPCVYEDPLFDII